MKPIDIYLCVPYSHPDAVVRQSRFEAANKAAAKLMSDGNVVFSPISHSHPVALHMDGMANDCEFWLDQDRAFLSMSKRVVVLKIYGWDKSKGIGVEVSEALRAGVPVEYMEP